jgi:phosphohistidine phosphatase
MKLYLVRHTEAHAIGEAGAATDELRPLTDKGLADARAIGRALRRLDVRPATVWCSPLRRARQTAEALAAELKGKVEPVEHDALAPPGDAAWLANRAGKAGADDELVAVGHEPFLGQMLQHLLNGPGLPPLPLGKGAVACLERHAGEREFRLRWLITPKLTKRFLPDD